MQHRIKFATKTEHEKVYNLYKVVAKNVGTIARTESEITNEYISNKLHKSIENGACFIVENPENKSEIIAEIHCYKLQPNVFNHVLSELTVVVHPKHQGKGIGKQLFKHLLHHIEQNRKDILRVELIARESNENAIRLYNSIGFIAEGKFENRILNNANKFESDIPMAWFNKNFQK